MSTFARTDTSLLGRWWWTVDRWTLAAVVALAAIGAVLTLAASPAVAERIGLDTFHFARRQFVFLPLALAVVLGVSLMAPRGVLRLAAACFAAAVVLMVATVAFGQNINGATRWISIGGLSIQASEFAKPGFAVIAAWLLARGRIDEKFPGYRLASALFAVVAALLLLQPDVGMTIVVAAVWGVQFFLAGLGMGWVVLIVLVFMGGAAGA